MAQVVKTSLLLPTLKNTISHASGGESQEEYVSLPISSYQTLLSSSSTLRTKNSNDPNCLDLESYFAHKIPSIRQHAQQWFQFHLSHIPSLDSLHEHVTDKYGKTILYVCQREIAYSAMQQTNPVLLISDRATTCHIVAVYSQQQEQDSQVHPQEEQTGHAVSPTLASLCHMDSPSSAESIQDVIQTHLKYHKKMKDKIKDKEKGGNPILLDITFHFLGGFRDSEGVSKEISNHLLFTLLQFIVQYESRNKARTHPILDFSIRWKLGTYLISYMNDSQTFLPANCISPSNMKLQKRGVSPIGQGLALDVSTGQVFLAKLDNMLLWMDSIVPAFALRSARLWLSANHLIVIHSPLELKEEEMEETNLYIAKNTRPAEDLKNQNYPMTRDAIYIEPFELRYDHNLDFLLNVHDDETFLRYTSSSPEYEEKEEFCYNVRRTFQYIRDVSCTNQIFASKVGDASILVPVVYQYDKNQGKWTQANLG